LAHFSSPVLCAYIQATCPMLQLEWSTGIQGASISFERCVGHKGMMKLMNTPALNVKARKCTNCSGCKECKQPVPLTIPKSIGGSGCTAEVAAKAEVCANWQPARQVQAAPVQQAPNTRLAVEGQRVVPAAMQQGLALQHLRQRPPVTQLWWSVLCATASQGTLVYLPPSSCVGSASRCATAALNARGRTGSWGTRRSVRCCANYASHPEVSAAGSQQGMKCVTEQHGSACAPSHSDVC
jgi:hypothetical protein